MFQSAYPWEDNGDEVVLDKVVAPNVAGQPFEVFFERPCFGYGYLFVGAKGIALNFPKGKGSAYGGHAHLNFDFDGDGQLDADDAGCLVAILATIGLGYLFKKLATSGDKKRINWPIRLPKEAIEKVSVNGRTMVISHAGKKPDIELRVAEEDGERLYRELYRHYPGSVSRWTYLIREVIDDLPTKIPSPNGGL